MESLPTLPGIDTNNCMNLTTRERLLQAATRLFADNGYRGASVRDICNLAGANPGAISYHFGGKRQLYRAVLRRAAAGLADMGPAADDDNGDREPVSVLDALQRVLDRMQLDKKTVAGQLRFVLPTKMGHVQVFRDVPIEHVRAVLEAGTAS